MMNETTTETLTTEQMNALVNSNLIGGILIGVVASWTFYRAKKWYDRKSFRIIRRNKEEVNAQKS
jgi:hypothetical protein